MHHKVHILIFYHIRQVSNFTLKSSHNKLNLYNLYTFAFVTETCEHFGSHNADKLTSYWISFLGGPEDDRLGRNMSP